jgi:PIN domain nuclease of toxin-antitoxin system
VRLLLDTHILVWLIDDQLSRLPFPIRALIEDEDADFFGSAMSLWEIVIKHRLGKLPLPCAAEELPQSYVRMSIRLLPLTPSHAVTAVEPWPTTKDPFDRILLSICAAENLRLVTIDKKLRDHPLAWRA